MVTEHAVTTSGASSVNVPRDSCLAPMKSVKVLYMWLHTLMCLNMGHLKLLIFHLGQMENLMVQGVLKLLIFRLGQVENKWFKVSQYISTLWTPVCIAVCYHV